MLFCSQRMQLMLFYMLNVHVDVSYYLLLMSIFTTNNAKWLSNDLFKLWFSIFSQSIEAKFISYYSELFAKLFFLYSRLLAVLNHIFHVSLSQLQPNKNSIKKFLLAIKISITKTETQFVTTFELEEKKDYFLLIERRGR